MSDPDYQSKKFLYLPAAVAMTASEAPSPPGANFGLT